MGAKEILMENAELQARIAKLVPDASKRAAFCDALVAANPCFNPLPGFDLLLKTLEKRQAAGVSFESSLGALDADQKVNLAKDFKAFTSRCLAEWSAEQPELKANGSKLSAVYHRAPHGMEMAQDAEVLLKKHAEKIQDPNSRQILIQMAKAAHAVHDIIQDKSPPANEIESYEYFMKNAKAFIEKIAEPQRSVLTAAIDNFAWETIVVGTVFHFGKKQPLVDLMNRMVIALDMQPLKQPDPFVEAASKAAGSNDTGRNEVAARGYFDNPHLRPLLEEQHAFTRGDHNILMHHLTKKEKVSDPTYSAAVRHLTGQNMRMICELNTHFPDALTKELQLGFADFLTKLIEQASTAFSENDHQRLMTEGFKDLSDDLLREYFNLLMVNLDNEVKFAEGFTPEGFRSGFTDFATLYPGYAFEGMGAGNIWQQYAKDLKEFTMAAANKIRAESDPEKKKLMMKVFMRDMALYAGHQVGAALLRRDENYRKELVNLKGELEKRVALPPSDPKLEHKLKRVSVDLDRLDTQIRNENLYKKQAMLPKVPQGEPLREVTNQQQKEKEPLVRTPSKRGFR